MMNRGDVDLKPLVMSCLEDDPELRPSVIDTSERIKKMKEVYSKKNSRDRMSRISWLAEITQTSLSTQLEVCYCRLICSRSA